MKIQNNIIIAVVAVIMIGVLITVVVANRKSNNAGKENTTSEEAGILPTVDASVKVGLEGKNNNRAVALTISGVPNGTTSIEYSLSYDTEGQGLQGIIGTIEMKDGEDSYTTTRELGTCSSGACVYHDVSGPVKVELKFNGSYGEKIFD
jgi:hypothetical protein